MTPDRYDVVIIGAGGFSREAAAAVLACADAGGPQRLLGFADDDPTLRNTTVDGIPVLGEVQSVVQSTDARYVIGIGRPDNYTSRYRIVDQLALPRDRYATVVHPGAHLATDTHVGVGSVVLAATVATTAVRVGDHAAVMPGVVLTHDDYVGDFSTLASGVLLGGNVTVGTGAYVGAGVVVRESASIGTWAMIGMGSVVTRDVPAGELWLGAPARFHRRAPVPAELVAASGS